MPRRCWLMQVEMGMFVSTFYTTRAESSLPDALEREKLLQSVMKRKTEAPKSVFLPYISTAKEVLLPVHGTAYLSSCMQERRLHTKLHWKKRESDWSSGAVCY